MIQNNRLWVLMSRLLSGEADPSEAEELQQLLEQQDLSFDPNLSSGPTNKHIVRTPDGLDIARSPDDTGPDTPAYKGRIVRWPFYKMAGTAAAAAAIILLGWGLFRLRTGTSDDLKAIRGGEVLSRAGARTKLVLPDGTQVWLNSSS